MKPGTKVKVLIDTFMAEAGSLGVVHDKNLTEGLISVAYLDYYEPDSKGPILDFSPEYLEVVDD